MIPLQEVRVQGTSRAHRYWSGPLRPVCRRNYPDIQPRSKNKQCATALPWNIAQCEIIHASTWPSASHLCLTQNIPDTIT